jgi:hypothetical protein
VSDEPNSTEAYERELLEWAKQDDAVTAETRHQRDQAVLKRFRDTQHVPTAPKPARDMIEDDLNDALARFLTRTERQGRISKTSLNVLLEDLQYGYEELERLGL